MLSQVIARLFLIQLFLMILRGPIFEFLSGLTVLILTKYSQLKFKALDVNNLIFQQVSSNGSYC